MPADSIFGYLLYAHTNRPSVIPLKSNVAVVRPTIPTC